jgi:hypothetical protein
MREMKGLGGYGIKGLRKTILNAGFLILDWIGDWSRHRGCGTRFRAPKSRRMFRYWPPKTYPRPSKDAAPQWLIFSLTRRLYAECRNVVGNPVIVLGYVRA